MSQYFSVCNLDKKEYLDALHFNHGAKLVEIARSNDGVMTALAILLTLSGGPVFTEGPIYGRWAGDRIAIIGDYYEGAVAGNQWSDGAFMEIIEQRNGWVDISEHVIQTLKKDWGLDIPINIAEPGPRSVLHADGTITAIPTSN